MKVTSAFAILCFTAAHAVAVTDKRDASPRLRITSCGVLGNSCARDASPDAHFRWGMTSCGVPGNSCAKAKRAALAVAEALAEAQPRLRITSCGILGNSCAKARRSLEEVGALTESVLDKVLAVDEDDEAIARRDELIHDQFPGGSNSKVEEPEAIHFGTCGLPGVDCVNAKRGIDLIKEEFPTIHKEECFADGGECDVIAKAHAAFHAAVKREADARLRITSCGILGNSCARDASARLRITSCGILGNSCARDAADAEQEKLKGNPEYLKAEEECYAPDGECTAADKYLEELEVALNKANEAAHTD